MGYAENTQEFGQVDGFKIQHDLDQPQLQHWPNPEVIKIGDTYHCFSVALGYSKKAAESRWQSRQSREAVSKDGIH